VLHINDQLAITWNLLHCLRKPIDLLQRIVFNIYFSYLDAIMLIFCLVDWLGKGDDTKCGLVVGFHYEFK